MQNGTISPPRRQGAGLTMDEVAQIREKIDIVGLISEYIPLKKMGRNFKSVCPFHNEKTPSFVVSPERQIWHCFGCHKGGDIFTFLMEYEKLEFVEALRSLAKKSGVELQSSSYQTGLSLQKEKIYTLNRMAMNFYSFILTKHPAGSMALSYLLKNRQIDLPLINTFMIGFSPSQGNVLSRYLVDKKGYKKEDLVEAGLSFYPSTPLRTSSGPRVLDFFRGRVMFPLFDHRNNVVGFSGRAIDDSTDGGKYINTRDTLVYHKGSMFFGLNMAKDEIKNQDQAIIVEGEFDVISAFKEGIKNVVAIKGTALTENQAALLSRFTQKVTLCLDQDAAGFEATKRSLAVLEKKGLNITAVALNQAKDPDEYIKKDPIAFKKALKNDVSVYGYIFERVISVNNKNTIEGKKKISDELLPLVMNIENEIVKEHYLKKLSSDLDTSYESLIREMERIEKKEIVKKDIVFAKKENRTRREILEEYLLSLIIQEENPKEALEKTKKILQDYTFELPTYRKIIDNLDSYFKRSNKFDSKSFLQSLPEELVNIFDKCFLFPLPKFADKNIYEKEIEKKARELRLLFIKDKIKSITANLKEEERKENTQQMEGLQKELSTLISLLSQ